MNSPQPARVRPSIVRIAVWMVIAGIALYLAITGVVGLVVKGA